MARVAKTFIRTILICDNISDTFEKDEIVFGSLIHKICDTFHLIGFSDRCIIIGIGVLEGSYPPIVSIHRIDNRKLHIATLG